jgi:hypothetical protein
MNALALALIALVSAAKPAAADGGKARYAAGQSAFTRGEFDKAIVALDAAADQAQDNEPLLVQIHLLRGRCFAALPDGNARAEEAFLRALEVDPEAKLDSSRVRPTVVSMLDELRARTEGELQVDGDIAGAQVELDGKPVGAAPFSGKAPVGRHTLRLRGSDGRSSEAQEVIVRVKTPARLALRLGPAAAKPEAEPPKAATAGAFSLSTLRPFADVRGAIEPVPPSGSRLAMVGEIGAGVGFKHLLGSLHLGFGGRSFAMAVRVTGAVPKFASIVGAHLSLDVPMMVLEKKFVAGLGGALGVDLTPTSWFEPFLEVQVRHFFALPTRADGGSYADNSVLIGLGVRLRLP